MIGEPAPDERRMLRATDDRWQSFQPGGEGHRQAKRLFHEGHHRHIDEKKRAEMARLSFSIAERRFRNSGKAPVRSGALPGISSFRKHIHLTPDNDKPGRSTAESIQKKLVRRFELDSKFLTYDRDFNDEARHMMCAKAVRVKERFR